MEKDASTAVQHDDYNTHHDEQREASPAWFDEGFPHIWQPYAQAKIAPLPLPVARTEGCRIILEDERELIDGISSWWCTPHGHNHPHLVEAAKAQLDVMPNVMFAGLAHAPAYRLAKRLVEIAPRTKNESMERVFFSDSGSTSVEVALKMALQYWSNQGNTQKTRFACLKHGYHGDTFGAMGVSDPARGMHSAYRPNVIEALALDVPQHPNDYDAFEATLKAHSQELAALIVEPLVQGAGGMLFYPPESLHFMRNCCKRHEVLFIVDEIMTGFGRTGDMFACETADIVPDILCIGKGLTGGIMTLAATLTQAHIYDAFYDDDMMKALMHGPTFMANPLACAVANASLDLYENEPRLEQVAAIGAHFNATLPALLEHPHVQDVRVRGAIGVVQIDTNHINPFDLRPKCVELGVWLRPYSNIIYITPPFVVSEEELQTLTDGVRALLEN